MTRTAQHVTVKFLPDKGRIEISDNGHGMTFDEFKNFWMRIVRPIKERGNPIFERQMTGSKGVGRLAVQFLAGKLEIITVPKRQGG